MKGILADAHLTSDVDRLVTAMQREPWTEFWQHLGLVLYRFEEVGLTPDLPDLEIWRLCQSEELVLITNNRNENTPDSLGVAIRTLGTAKSLPVFTIANVTRFQRSGEYFDRVLKALYDYLLDIDRVRGAGRLFLP